MSRKPDRGSDAERKGVARIARMRNSMYPEVQQLQARIAQLEREVEKHKRTIEENLDIARELIVERDGFKTEVERLRHKMQCLAFSMTDGIGSYEGNTKIDEMLLIYSEALEAAQHE